METYRPGIAGRPFTKTNLQIISKSKTGFFTLKKQRINHEKRRANEYQRTGKFSILHHKMRTSDLGQD